MNDFNYNISINFLNQIPAQIFYDIKQYRKNINIHVKINIIGTNY